VIELLIGAFTNIQKLTPKILLGISLSSGVLSFDNKYLIPLLKLENFITLNRDNISLFFIISSSLLLAYFIWILGTYLVDFIKNILSRNKQKSILKELTKEEKDYLSNYILNLKNSMEYDFADGIAQGLVKKGILYRPSHIGIACNIETWAREYLIKNKHLLN